jgi:hypothetical protein
MSRAWHQPPSQLFNRLGFKAYQRAMDCRSGDRLRINQQRASGVNMGWLFVVCGTTAAFFGFARRPWWQAAFLLVPMTAAGWYDFVRLKARWGERMLYPDPIERTLLIVAVSLAVITVGWAFGRWVGRPSRARL